MPRTATYDGPETRVPTRKCAAKGCSTYTRERKPFCPEHVLDAPYAKGLFDRVEGVENEIERVGEIGAEAVDMNGLVVEEILAGIAHAGQVTWRRLCKSHVAFLHSVESETTDHYRDRLNDAGLVEITRSSRGVEVVSLTPKGMLTLKGAL
jgi:hypothetical protein